MKHKIPVVFDTNIYISAIIFGGNPRVCLELVRQGEISLYTSREILVELAGKLREKFLWEEEDIQSAIKGILLFTTLVTPKEAVTIIRNDPKDNMILSCAQEAQAEYIVSGDKKHLLSLKNFKSIQIVSAKTFLDSFYKN